MQALNAILHTKHFGVLVVHLPESPTPDFDHWQNVGLDYDLNFYWDEDDRTFRGIVYGTRTNDAGNKETDTSKVLEEITEVRFAMTASYHLASYGEVKVLAEIIAACGQESQVVPMKLEDGQLIHKLSVLHRPTSTWNEVFVFMPVDNSGRRVTNQAPLVIDPAHYDFPENARYPLTYGDYPHLTKPLSAWLED